MPCFSVFDSFYDLLVPFIIYLGLFRSVRESVPVIIVMGFVMDNLSGSPPGLYLTAYLWLFAGVRWIVYVLHVGDKILLPFVVAAGVLLENIIFLGVIDMFEPGARFSSTAFPTVMVQVLWAAGTGPIFLILINGLHQGLNQWSIRVFSRITP
jgi:hypothetical protein